jgi:hypothetical protein
VWPGRRETEFYAVATNIRGCAVCHTSLKLPWISGKYMHPNVKGAFPRKHEAMLKNLPVRYLVIVFLNKDLNQLRTLHST